MFELASLHLISPGFGVFTSEMQKLMISIHFTESGIQPGNFLLSDFKLLENTTSV